MIHRAPVSVCEGVHSNLKLLDFEWSVYFSKVHVSVYRPYVLFTYTMNAFLSPACMLLLHTTTTQVAKIDGEMVKPNEREEAGV